MFSVEHIIATGGLALIGLIVFAESGLLAGFFLPGDTLLLAAGLFASQGKLSLVTAIIVIVICGIIGDNTGYFIGTKLGRRIFKKEDGIFFRKDYIDRAEKFYEKHGTKTVLIARFVPMARTFVPLISGSTGMSHKTYATYDAIGVTAWGVSITLLGYFFGSRVPNLDKYILQVLAVIIVLSFGSSIAHVVIDKWRHKRTPKDSPED